MNIAIFDSGIGGLSVLYQAQRMLPKAHYLYYADRAHVPYGEKTREQILTYTDEAVRFLIQQGADAIVLACNTATSVAAATLRNRYALPIIGMEPAVKLALDHDPVHRVLVAATPITISGNKLKILMEHYDNHHLVDLLPLPGLVRFAEQGIYTGEAVHAYLSRQLADFHLEDYSAFVLGCTHFNLFKQELRTLLPNTMHFVDGNAGTVRQLLRKVRPLSATARTPGVTYYTSGETVTDTKRLQSFADVLAHLDRMYTIE